MFKGLGKIVRDNKSSSYPVFELTGVNCIYWKNGPINRLNKKEKNQAICSTNFKGGTRWKPTGFVIKPRLILIKHKQIYTIVIIRCYHQAMLLWVSFLKAKAIEKGDFIKKKIIFFSF